MGYGVSKAGLHRIAGFLAVEYGDRGIRAFNVQPGFIATERIAADMAEFGFSPTGEPPEVVGAVVAWLATNPEAAALNGRNVEAQFFCAERKLLPGWEGPRPRDAALEYDLSAAELLRLEEDLAR
jgi:NAD(P)-dependent dehydrogenase (short-subunit alcohol dehydrogenase family)